MVTLQTGGTADQTANAMRELGVEPSWGSVVWKDIPLNASGDTAESWREHYVPPKSANGVLITLATITRKLSGVVKTSPEVKLPIAGTKK